MLCRSPPHTEFAQPPACTALPSRRRISSPDLVAGLLQVSSAFYGESVLLNRSAPHARVTPVLTVADVRAAVAWYTEILGFVEHVRIGAGHRSQLGLPDGPAAELVVAEVRPGRRTPQRERSHQVMLKVTDVVGLVERAVADGAVLIDEPHDWEYGERQAVIDDPFGHQWVLNQTLVDVAPEQWGGETVTARPSPA